MGIKFDKHITKYQLFHACISLATVLICMLYVQTTKSWTNIGKFRESLILPFVLLGEISKLILAKYFGRNEKDSITQQKQRKNQSLSYYNNVPKIKDILKAIILQTLCTIFYAFLSILLGAPVLKNYEQTFLLALLLTLLTVSPTVFLLGVNGTLQIAFCEKYDFLNKTEENCLELIKYNALGAIFGAWAGTVVVPLDWDREWQEYPIPNVFGALFGYGLVNIYACSKILFNTARVYLNKRR